MSGFGRRLSKEKYINLLTDFGFKRLFGTEPNKALLIADENSLKYYRDLKNVVDTSREEGREEERTLNLERQRLLLLRLLSRKLGDIPEAIQAQVHELSMASLEALSEAFLDFEAVEQLRTWLQRHG